jgi:hypothetical protein
MLSVHDESPDLDIVPCDVVIAAMFFAKYCAWYLPGRQIGNWISIGPTRCGVNSSEIDSC